MKFPITFPLGIIAPTLVVFRRKNNVETLSLDGVWGKGCQSTVVIERKKVGYAIFAKLCSVPWSSG